MEIANGALGDDLQGRLAAMRKGGARPFDPMGADAGSDRAMVASMRRLGRLAGVAAEVGARFSRDRIEMDPMEWLSAPRGLFDGKSAIEACQGRDGFVAGMLVHGLSLDLDADGADLAAMLVRHGGDREDRLEEEGIESVAITALVRRSAWCPRLFTATITTTEERVTLFTFVAAIAGDRTDFERMLRRRAGYRLADGATVRAGFDPGDPVCAMLVSGPVEDALRRAEADPTGPSAEGLDIHLEQRFAA